MKRESSLPNRIASPRFESLYLRIMKARFTKSACLFASLLLFIAPTSIVAAHGPLFIDLAASPLYARVGFDPAHIDTVPANGAPGWEKVPPAGAGGRTVRPVDLSLAGIPRRSFFSLDSFPTMQFTYIIPFKVSAQMARLVGASGPRSADASATAAPREAAMVPGMFFAGLADNWEIYLNGVLVKSEMHLAKDGSISYHRNLRDVRFAVDGRLFREGDNVLAARIVADPVYSPSGFNQAGPYYIDEYSSIERASVDVGPMVLIGLYLFIGLYHLFMFLVRRADRHNLYYGLFSLDLGVYLLMRTSTITLLGLDSNLVTRVELVTLCFILPLVGAFLEMLNETRIKKITLWYGALCSLIALGELVMPMPFAENLLLVWQFSGLVMAFYIFGIDILGRFLSDGRRRWKRELGAFGAELGTEGGRSLGRVYLDALVRTPIGNLLIGGALLFATGLFDIVDAMVMQWDLLLTKYGFFLFTMGTALILANRLGFLHDRLGGLNRTLEERIKVLTETGVRLSASESRYRSLFEGSSEAVALLTESLDFIEGNRAATELFGLDRPRLVEIDRPRSVEIDRPRSAVGDSPFNLCETLYAEKREGSLPAEFLRAAARSLKEKRGTTELILRIKAPVGDPRPCTVKLERIDAFERKEILLRAIPEEKDPLADCFVEARERFDVESSLTAADRVCRRATAYLATYADQDESRFLAGCVREVVINAVEHGNLQISFDEKSESMKAGRYFELLQERRTDPRFRSRKVVVEYSISGSRATFRVTDEGDGFDYKRFVQADGAPSAELLEHGRGLFITMSAFDKVLFNDKGNQVTLVKYFAKELAPARV